MSIAARPGDEIDAAFDAAISGGDDIDAAFDAALSPPAQGDVPPLDINIDRYTNHARMVQAMAQPATGTAIPSYSQNPNNPLSRPVPGGVVGQFATGAGSELMGLPATGARAAQAGVQFLANRAPADSPWGSLLADAASGVGQYAGGLEAITGVAKSGVGLPQETGGTSEMLGHGAAQLGMAVIPGAGPTSALGRAGVFAATSAAPVVGQTMRDAVTETGNAPKAAEEAATAGAITAVTSFLPGAAILQRVPGGAKLMGIAAKRAISRLAAAGIAEGSQEYMEGVGDEIATEMIRHDRRLTYKMALDALTNPQRMMDVLGGAVLGTVAHAPFEAVGHHGVIPNAFPDAQPAASEATATPANDSAPTPAAEPRQPVGDGAAAEVGAQGQAAADVPAAVDPLTNPEATDAEILAALRELDTQAPEQASGDTSPIAEPSPTTESASSEMPLQPQAKSESVPPDGMQSPDSVLPTDNSSPNPTTELQSSKPVPIHAITTKDGRVLSDPSVMAHFQVADKYGVPYEDVADSGWVIGGKYESSDGFYKPSQKTQETYNAKLAERKNTGEEPVSVKDAPQVSQQPASDTSGAESIADPTTPAQWRAEARRLGVSDKGTLAKVRERVRGARDSIRAGERESSSPATPVPEDQSGGPQFPSSAVQAQAFQLRGKKVPISSTPSGVSDEVSSTDRASFSSPTVPTPPAGREAWEMTRSEFLDWTRTQDYKSRRASAEAAESAAESNLVALENEIGVNSKSPLAGVKSADGISPQAFGLAQLADSLREKERFDKALAGMPDEFRKLHAQRVRDYELAHARVRSFEDLETAKSVLADYPTLAAKVRERVRGAVAATSQDIAVGTPADPNTVQSPADTTGVGTPESQPVVRPQSSPLTVPTPPAGREGPTDAQLNRAKMYTRRNAEFFTHAGSRGNYVLAKYQTGSGITVYDRILPDGKVEHGGNWPMGGKNAASPQMAKGLERRYRKAFGSNAPVPSPSLAAKVIAGEASAKQAPSLPTSEATMTALSRTPDTRSSEPVQGARLQSGGEASSREQTSATRDRSASQSGRNSSNTPQIQPSAASSRTEKSTSGAESLDQSMRGVTSPKSNPRRRGAAPEASPVDAGGGVVRSERALGTSEASMSRKLIGNAGKRSGWYYMETSDGAALVHPTDDKAVLFKEPNSKKYPLEARVRAKAYADDNPIVTPKSGPSTPPGELVIKPVFEDKRWYAGDYVKAHTPTGHEFTGEVVSESASGKAYIIPDGGKSSAEGTPVELIRGGNARRLAEQKPKGSDVRRRGAAINPIEEVADMLRRAKAQGRKAAAGPARDVAKIEARAAKRAANALRKAEASAARLSAQLGDTQEVNRAYRDVLRESRRDLQTARADLLAMGVKLRDTTMREKVREEARAMVVQVAQRLPRRLQGTLITDARDAGSFADVLVAVNKARDAVARDIGREAKTVLDRYTSRKVKGKLSDEARARLADIELKADDARRRFDAPLASSGDAAVEMANLADQARAVVHEYRLENKLIREGQFWDAEIERQKITDTLASKKPLPLTADGKGRTQPGIITNLFRGNMNAFSIAKTLDGFKDGPVSQLMQEIQGGQSRRFELTEAATMQADAAAHKAGFDNLSHLMAATSDLLGEGLTIRHKVKLGGKDFTLTLGELAKLYSTEQDVNTRNLIAAGKPIQFRQGGKFSDPVRLTAQDFARVAELIPEEIRTAVDSMKSTRDRMFPAVQKVIRTLKGYEPPKEPGYEPRFVNRELSGASTDAEFAPDLSGMIEKHIENAGFTIERVKDKTNPLIIGDFFHDWARSVNGQADVIALATPIANARKVLMHPTTKQAIAERYGDIAPRRIREVLIDSAGLRADPGSITAVVQRLTRNVSYARTSLRATSWLIQGAGVPRLAAEMPGSAFASGIRGALSPSLGRRMMEGSPMLRKRYSGSLASINTSLGDPSTAIAPHTEGTLREALGTAGRAGKAVVHDIAKGDIGGAVNKALPELFDTIRISNFFDSIPARVAWAGFEAEAERTGKDQAWVREQAEGALSKVLNSSDPLHLTAFGSRLRNTSLVPFTAFTSDAASAWNQVYQGFGESRSKGLKATAGVVAGALWASAVTGTAGYLGKLMLEDKDEDKARKEALRQAVTRFIQETIGMGFIEGKLADVLDAGAKGFDVNVADAPMIGAINQSIRSVYGLSTAIYDRLASEDPAKVESATQRFVDALARLTENAGALAGNPLTPTVGTARKAIKSEMGGPDKSLRDIKKEVSGDTGTSPEESLGRRQLYDAMSKDGDMTTAFATLKKAGVRLSKNDLEALVKSRDPNTGLKARERREFREKLAKDPAAKAEYERRMEENRKAARSIGKAMRAQRQP